MRDSVSTGIVENFETSVGKLNWNCATFEDAAGMRTMNRRVQLLSRHVTGAKHGESFPRAVQTVTEKRTAVPVVIGGMVLDIQASPSFDRIQPGTTVPGEVRFVSGGVGRNVAECLAKLDTPPFLISVVGDDMAGHFLLAHWNSLRLSVAGIRICAGASTPAVSAVFDDAGELAAAVADTQAVEVHLTPDWINRFVTEIQAAPVVLLDANLHPLALRAACKLANEAGVPVWFEPVSLAKAVRACGLMNTMTFVSPNEAELMAISKALQPKKGKKGCVVQKSTTLECTLAKSASDILGIELRDAIEDILNAGVKYVVLTIGSEGAILAFKEQLGQVLYHHYPAMPSSVLKLTGAGDCLVAGTLAALSREVIACQAIAYGVAAAKFAVESDLNVPETLSWAEIKLSSKYVLRQTRTLMTIK